MPNRDATEEGLRSRADIEGWIFVVSATITAILIAIAPERFLGSTAWEYILGHLPGGYPALTTWIALGALGMLAAACCRFPWPPIPYFVAGCWYIWVAVFQLVCVLSEPNGPLGFMAWGPLGVLIIEYGLGQTKRLR